MRTILVATRSVGKQREILQMLNDLRYRILFPAEAGLAELSEEEAIETAETFEGNARRKAEYFTKRSGLPTAAEDSGIEVFTLGGAPGVRSRRFAPAAPDQDAANNALLLRKLEGAPAERRRARYRSVIVFLENPGAIPQTFEGSCAGTILEVPKGRGGFGYDPIFLSDDLGKSFGEAAPDEKHAVSHRGRALRAFVTWLAASDDPADMAKS